MIRIRFNVKKSKAKLFGLVLLSVMNRLPTDSVPRSRSYGIVVSVLIRLFTVI